MSRGNKWVPIDKYAVQSLRNINRPYSKVEAIVSHTVDIDCGKNWTINGYAKQWQWSRCKVRKFLSELKTDCGHIKDTTRTDYRHPIHFIDKGLWENKDTLKTDSRQIKDTLPDTTTNPNPNPNPNEKEIDEKYIKFSTDFYCFLSKEMNGKKRYDEKTIRSGADTIEKIVRLDGYDFQDEVVPTMRWAIKDDFWSRQVRSLSPLRKKSKNNGLKKFENIFNSYSDSKIFPNGLKKSYQSTRDKNNSDIHELYRGLEGAAKFNENQEINTDDGTDSNNTPRITLPQ